MKFSTALFTHLLGRVRYGGRLRPLRDWSLLLSLAAALLAAAVCFHVWLFARVGNGQGIEGAAPAAHPFDGAPLDAVKELFSSRASQADQYARSYRFVDPAL